MGIVIGHAGSFQSNTIERCYYLLRILITTVNERTTKLVTDTNKSWDLLDILQIGIRPTFQMIIYWFSLSHK